MLKKFWFSESKGVETKGKSCLNKILRTEQEMIIFTEYHSRIVAAKCDWWEVSEPDDDKDNMGYIANKIDCLANSFFSRVRIRPY